MRSPAEYFIKYLISRDQSTSAMIIRILGDMGIDVLVTTIKSEEVFINEEYVDKLAVEMGEFPEPWLPGTDDEASTDFLRKHSIRDLWFPNANVKEAYTILGTPQLRSDVEQLLLAPIRIEVVSARLKKHRDISVSVGGLTAYRHYFWNKSLLSVAGWLDFLELRPGSHVGTMALTISPDFAAEVVPWASGMSGPPDVFTSGDVSRRVRDVAFLKVLEIEHREASLAHSKMLRNYEDVIRYSESEMRQSDVALREVLKAFEKFKLRTDVSKIPSIEEIAGPNYSASGEGTDAAEEDDDL